MYPSGITHIQTVWTAIIHQPEKYIISLCTNYCFCYTYEVEGSRTASVRDTNFIVMLIYIILIYIIIQMKQLWNNFLCTLSDSFNLNKFLPLPSFLEYKQKLQLSIPD